MFFCAQVWDSTGWLSALSPSPLLGVGAIDHAGCGVVHLVGAVTGLWGAIATGPRLGRFAVDGTPRPIPGHSAPLILLGGCVGRWGERGWPGVWAGVGGWRMVKGARLWWGGGGASVGHACGVSGGMAASGGGAVAGALELY